MLEEKDCKLVFLFQDVKDSAHNACSQLPLQFAATKMAQNDFLTMQIRISSYYFLK